MNVRVLFLNTIVLFFVDIVLLSNISVLFLDNIFMNTSVKSLNYGVLFRAYSTAKGVVKESLQHPGLNLLGGQILQSI